MGCGSPTAAAAITTTTTRSTSTTMTTTTVHLLGPILDMRLKPGGSTCQGPVSSILYEPHRHKAVDLHFGCHIHTGPAFRPEEGRGGMTGRTDVLDE